MNSKQRLEAVIAGETPDRSATLGDWISAPRDLIKLSNMTEGDYLRDRDTVAVTSYQNLGVDGLLGYIANGKSDLTLFTSNTTTPDLPLENLIAMYDEAKKICY